MVLSDALDGIVELGEEGVFLEHGLSLVHELNFLFLFSSTGDKSLRLLLLLANAHRQTSVTLDIETHSTFLFECGP